MARRPSRTNDQRPPTNKRRRTSAHDEWRDAEQQTTATEAAAQELLARSGSAERAKDAIDKVEDAHPP